MTYSIAQYLNVRQAYAPSIAADGQQLAFLANITDMPQVWQTTLTPDSAIIGWPDQLTFGTDRVLGVRRSPLPGDDRLIFARDIGGNENAQLVLLSPGSGVEQALTAGHEQAMHTFGAWSDDGTQIMFSANRRHPGRFDLYLQPLGGAARMVWQHDEPGYLRNQTFAPDGRHAVVVRVASNARHDLFEIDLERGTARQITPGDEAARFTSLGYIEDGRALLLTTDLGADLLYIARLDLATLALEPLVSAEWDIEHVQCSPNAQQVAYMINEDGITTLRLLDLQSGSTRTAPPFIADAPGVIGFLDEQLTFARDGRRLFCSFTSATRSSDIFVWDLDSDQVRPVTRSAHGGLPTSSFVAPTLIRYPSFDERQIPAWFYMPTQQSASPLPAVVLVHGGPESQSVPAFNFLIQYLLHNGYAVLAPNVRGSTGYGKVYSHLDDGRQRPDAVADLAHAAYWLRAQPNIDGERLAVYGGSYGGYMVLAGMTSNPELWAAGVDLVGPSNFVTFLENTSEYRRAHREAEYGSLAHDREFLEATAPINHLDRIAAPLLVLHGANDPRVPLSEAEQLVAKLRERGIAVELIVFDDEGHGIVKLKNKLVAYAAIVAFLDTHLRV